MKGSFHHALRDCRACPNIRSLPSMTCTPLKAIRAVADQDNLRTGYDCGGLVRYSLQQGAGIDVDQGTNTIDRGGRLDHVAPLVPGASIGNANTQAGNILIFEGSQPWAADWDTTHTGIYLGNGYMINAPGSGDPVRVDPVQGHGKADILRIPGS